MFWVDRFQGGTHIYPYTYDRELIDYYDRLLGERFLGFQMHEWVSNMLFDFHKIIGDMYTYKDIESSNRLAERADRSVGGIIDAVMKLYPDPNGEVYIEAMTPEEWSRSEWPTGTEPMLRKLTELFRDRQSRVDGHLLATDSCLTATRLELENGLRATMPEIGAQNPFARIQLAIARGAHRAHGIPFGAYQEPWGGEPFSCCYFKRDKQNEWGIIESENGVYAPAGENGGSSMSLLRRIYFFAFLAGAQFLSEEWGACNTFYDWQDFEITPYGKIKKDFIDFARAYPELGEPYTPFALVLPSDLKIVNFNRINSGFNFFRFVEEFPLIEDQRREQHIYDVLRRIYDRIDVCERTYECSTLTNSPFGDLFDVVYEDDPGILDRYDYLIDLTGKPDFAAKNASAAARILPSGDIEKLAARLGELSAELTGITVEGGPMWMMNVNGDVRTLSFFNNEGILRSVAEGERVLEGCECSVTVALPENCARVKPIFGAARIERDGRMLRFTLEPGDILIIQLAE